MRGAFTIKAVNTWGLGLISTNREGTQRYFHFDAIGSTRALTDSSETVTDTYEYNAFGVVESSSGTSVNPFRYVGQYGYYDNGAMGSSSGLLLLGVRYYSPAHGRFWSWDPVPNLNLYAYVGNSATMVIDPSGMLPWDLCGFKTWIRAGCSHDARESCRTKCARVGLTYLTCVKLPFTCYHQCICLGIAQPPPYGPPVGRPGRAVYCWVLCSLMCFWLNQQFKVDDRAYVYWCYSNCTWGFPLPIPRRLPEGDG